VKFGVQNLFPAEGEDDHRVLLQALEEIKIADELGFDSVWLTEHHFSRYGILGNPMVLGAAIAETTHQIEIGTAVVVLPFHNPLRLAEDAATLDIISGGRLELGVGRGYQPKEFAGFGIDAETSKQRYAEVVEILKLAWTGRPFSFHGEYYDVDEVTVSPRPVRTGGPPIRHAVVSPASFPERGARGDHIITSPTFAPLGRMKRNFDAYRDALIESGHDPHDYDIPFMQQAWVGSSESDLHAVAESALSYYRTVGKVVPGSDEAIAAEAEYYEKVRNNIALLTLEQTLTHGGNFGSVDQVVDTIGRLATELGVTHYIGWFHIPTLDRGIVLEAMETFAAEVIPQLRDVGATPQATAA
jgi:alkanesulfonate monooxygenase SsuD/methylene tetrahydromethanopterin reductase-like flavin-dependent oxidoreductase (luciferase family)